MFKKILLGLLVIIIAFVVIVAMQPSHFSIQRSATISASPSVVFNQVNDFHNWEAWSPWAKLDPACKKTFEGAPSGTGAGYAWSGDNKVGEGRMTIMQSRPNEFIAIKLDFIRPMTATSAAEFTFKPDADKTTVKWTMTGENNFVGKAFCLFMNMDKTVGGDFDKGLAQVKAVAEAPPAK